MNIRSFFAHALAGSLFFSVAAQAEIVLLDDGRAFSVGSSYQHAHPRLSSLVFVSSHARDFALWPSVSYFVPGAPLLLGGALPQITYPPAIYRSGIHPTASPSNRDNVSYSLARAHAFSQDGYDKDSYLRASSPGYNTWLNAANGFYYPYAPVNAAGGFNQPVRPSNRDNTSYNLDRAHRFSMDAYKKP